MNSRGDHDCDYVYKGIYQTQTNLYLIITLILLLLIWINYIKLIFIIIVVLSGEMGVGKSNIL